MDVPQWRYSRNTVMHEVLKGCGHWYVARAELPLRWGLV